MHSSACWRYKKMLELKDWSELLDTALKEDHASDDVTSKLFSEFAASKGVDAEKQLCRFQLTAKEDLLFCGAGLLNVLRERSGWTFESDASEGQWVKSGDSIIHGSAPFFDLLSLERSFLNILQHLSGISTRTHRAVTIVDEAWQLWSEGQKEELDKPEVLHTRKTLPGWRRFQIFACLAGGGSLHRLNLADRAMIKDNHRAFLSQQKSSFEQMREWAKNGYQDVWQEALFEADTLAEALDLHAAGAQHLLLDNFTPASLPAAISKLNCRSIEVSGGITLDNLKNYVLPGVTRISLGSLTHSVKAADISLEILD